jgi:hypothetical protein
MGLSQRLFPSRESYLAEEKASDRLNRDTLRFPTRGYFVYYLLYKLFLNLNKFISIAKIKILSTH